MSRDEDVALENASLSSHEPALEELLRAQAAERIVHKYVLLSMGAGVIPLPGVDVVASVGLQMKLIQELSDLYGVDHRKDFVRNAVGSLVTTLGGITVASQLGASFAKVFPGLGTTVGVVQSAALFGISTHLSGKFLILHFESGGTLLNLDPARVRQYYHQEFTNSQRYVQEIQRGDTRQTESP